MPPLSTRTALPTTQTILSSQKHFVFHASSIANIRSQNDTVGLRQPIIHEYAHLYFAINQKTTTETKIPAKFNMTSATINTTYNQISTRLQVHLRILFCPTSPAIDVIFFFYTTQSTHSRHTYVCTQCVFKYTHHNARTVVQVLHRKGHATIPHVLASICR